MNNLGLDIQDRSLLLFGGKGGSGKTTSACATSLYLAKHYPKKKILIVSCDPAHSVGDSFGCTIGNTITPIDPVRSKSPACPVAPPKEDGIGEATAPPSAGTSNGVNPVRNLGFNPDRDASLNGIKGLDNLWALEIEANVVGEDFKKEHEVAIKKIADRGTYFDQQDIADFYELTIPGLDEIMAIIRIADLLKDKQYDLIILDTAPTGHTIRLLGLPAEMEKWIHLMVMMQTKHKFLAKQFTGRYRKDDADEFLETMSGDISRVRTLLSNPQSTEFFPVTIPEPMSIDETEKLLRRLKSYQIQVKNIIVNRVAAKESQCPFCKSREKDQRQNIALIEEKFSDYNLHKMPLFPYEIRGIDRLEEYAQILFGETYEYKPIRRSFSPLKPKLVDRTQISGIIKKDLKFIIFGGKGGVGKTSLACATALRKARENPDKRILIFSTDPAHALSDSFATSIGDTLTPIYPVRDKTPPHTIAYGELRGRQVSDSYLRQPIPYDKPTGQVSNGVKEIDNLYGFEMDAPKLLEDWKREHREWIEELFNRFGKGVDIKFDREVMEELFTVTPPGLDELLALNEITDFIKDERFDVYVLDSAATGHLIRFLEMPHVIRDWLKSIFKLLLKYKGVVRLNKVAEEMIDLSKKVRKVQEILTDSDNTEFVAITIPEEMGFAETEDLLAALLRLKVPCHHMIVNMVIPPNQCSFCSAKMEEQFKAIGEMVKRAGEYQISQIPLFPYQIKGIDRLEDFSKEIYG